VPSLAALIAFAFLAALLVYVILQVPLTADDEPVIDLRDRRHPHDAARHPAHAARLVFVDGGSRTVTVDGVLVDDGSPFALEVRRPEGWSTDDADLQLAAWAAGDTVVELRVRDDLRGQRVWISDGEAALDLPVAGMLGVQSAR
jgi:hypothetical protein